MIIIYKLGIITKNVKFYKGRENMIRRSSEMKIVNNENMRGGDGIVSICHVLDKGEYKGASRLLGTITLKPGCSIGAHVHENEEEVFYIIEGTAAYNDNGKTEILNKGDSCICLSGEEHSIANREAEGDLVLFAAILTY